MRVGEDIGDPNVPECGDIHFTPAAGPAGTRRIYAVTTMNGEVTDRRAVATYDAPREPMPEEIPELDVRRVPEGISIGFKPSKARFEPLSRSTTTSTSTSAMAAGCSMFFPVETTR